MRILTADKPEDIDKWPSFNELFGKEIMKKEEVVTHLEIKYIFIYNNLNSIDIRLKDGNLLTIDLQNDVRKEIETQKKNRIITVSYTHLRAHET